jgi:hypothetical protein
VHKITVRTTGLSLPGSPDKLGTVASRATPSSARNRSAKGKSPAYRCTALNPRKEGSHRIPWGDLSHSLVPQRGWLTPRVFDLTAELESFMPVQMAVAPLFSTALGSCGRSGRKVSSRTRALVERGACPEPFGIEFSLGGWGDLKQQGVKVGTVLLPPCGCGRAGGQRLAGFFQHDRGDPISDSWMWIIKSWEQGFKTCWAGSFHEQMSRMNTCLRERGVEERRGKEGGAQFRGGVGCHRKNFHARFWVLSRRADSDGALEQSPGEESDRACRGEPVIEVGGFERTGEHSEEESGINRASECGDFGAEIIVGCGFKFRAPCIGIHPVIRVGLDVLEPALGIGVRVPQTVGPRCHGKVPRRGERLCLGWCRDGLECGLQGSEEKKGSESEDCDPEDAALQPAGFWREIQGGAGCHGATLMIARPCSLPFLEKVTTTPMLPLASMPRGNPSSPPEPGVMSMEVMVRRKGSCSE